MGILPKIIRSAFAGRLREVEHFRRYPIETQDIQLRKLLRTATDTSFGREHDFGSIDSIERFQSRVPIRDYEELTPYIERARKGEVGVLWPGTTGWFAKSSGTTGARSKYIPVTRDGLLDSHLRGPKDCIAFNVDRHPSTEVYGGKTLTLGGSRRIEREGEQALTGDLSAILIENSPCIANLWRVPSLKTALTPDFEEKVELICRECADKDVRSIVGVPSWNLVMLRRILEYTGRTNLLEVWPRLELFVHGGVNFAPYREVYHQLIPSDSMNYQETYNASEGFFAVADEFGEDMLLMLDYGIFYEFLPLNQIDNPSATITLADVQVGVNYAVVISSTSGLWRYLIGDTVQFTSTSPYRIRISGRTKQYINAFGEEIIVDNAERAIVEACRVTGAKVAEYTAAPIYMDRNKRGAHEWVVEFSCEPAGGVETFGSALDRALRELNSDYDAKRWHDVTLCEPVISQVTVGTFNSWMSSRGKSGGQNKVPRLANSREYVDEILKIR